MSGQSLKIALSFFLGSALTAQAAETTSATGSMFKMLVGLAVVLMILAIISWMMKKWMPNANQQQSVIRVVGGTSVGTRERVVVLEVANRWIVVGVAAGQVTSLANLEAGSALNIQTAENLQEKFNLNEVASNSFAKWLKASAAKMTDKKEQKDA